MAFAFWIQCGEITLDIGPAARRDRYKLPLSDRETDRRGYDPSTRVKRPEFLPCFCVKSKCVSFQIAAENQIARCRQQGGQVVILRLELPLLFSRGGIKGAYLRRSVGIQN